MESMLNDNNGDDLFGAGAAPAGSQDGVAQPENIETPVENQENQEIAENTPQEQQENEDDIYAAYNEPAAEPEKVSALVEWQEKKNVEIAQIDSKEEEDIQKMKQKANDDLAAYYKKLEEGQESRKKHNLDVDKETIASLEEKHDNQWEGVVSFIDFNRADLHVKDVSRMKTLLLQLKH
ncbi:hypothetical protein TVAG_062930 [Trichomonas vaginalis G3]|uniref:Clathrin light chain n=1 Tax=Trichomonas vaginalis (strain ATCC PRA-98 / G3) TaxID=412133 RepID=A2DLQ5_TRIV3|nr:clathrin light chain family [Trichomonas vaginalis G3]EAY18688.1 hypothetical protein TVAG_062930 [Trichomonas vaginalis G3]KAI5522587.1 clathrin light chain family [Trichomonas vaginalis G3]|eukprot:XP_001579674.1 hypothetical protein [Trichomonas vaginalis G3]